MIDQTLGRSRQFFLVGFLTTVFFVNFLSRIVLAPLMPLIERDLGLGYAGAGSFFLVIASGYAAGLFGSGFFSAWLTHRKTIALAAVSGGCAFCMLSIVHSLWMMVMALLLLGVATGIYLPSGITTITSSVSMENWGKMIGFHELAPAIGYIVAPLLVEVLLNVCSWKAIIALIGIIGIVLGILFLRIAPAGNLRGEAPTLSSIKELLSGPSFWIITTLFGLAIGSSVGIYSMMPLYLVSKGEMTRGAANTLVGFSRIPVIFMALAAGWISDRIGPKLTIIGALLFNGLTTVLLGILTESWLTLAVFLQPMLTICFFPAGFTFLSRIVPPRARNLSVAMTTVIAYLIGAGVIPTLLGVFGDMNHFGLAFILVGSLIFFSAFLMVLIDNDGSAQVLLRENRRPGR